VRYSVQVLSRFGRSQSALRVSRAKRAPGRPAERIGVCGKQH
jgi:hypothetical protein